MYLQIDEIANKIGAQFWSLRKKSEKELKKIEMSLKAQRKEMLQKNRDHIIGLFEKHGQDENSKVLRREETERENVRD